MRHEVLYNAGDQSIYHVPRDRDGRAIRVTQASSPAYQILDLTRSEDDTDRVIQASTAATVDTASTTVSSDSGPSQSDAKRISVASSVGFSVGHSYLIEQGGKREIFVLAATDTAELHAEHELQNDYTSSANVYGLELTGTFPTAEAADEDDMEAGGGPYAVIWDYTISGREYNPIEEIWVMRYSATPLITTADVSVEWPLAASMSRERVKIGNAIAAASSQFAAELESAAEFPERLLHALLKTIAVRKLAVAYLKRWLPSDQHEADADRLEQEYHRHFNDLVTGQYAKRTVKIDQASATADRGGERGSGEPRFRIS